MKVLITGSDGQLGYELVKMQTQGVEIHAFDIFDLDITNFNDVSKKVMELNPDVIINAAAYTAVDKAEIDSEAAYLVNETGAENLGRACAENNCRMIHVSTDFVFDGSSSRPYTSDDTPSPVGVYGLSKLKGEEAVFRETNGNALIIRTAWVYSAHGNNFVKTMLRLMAEKDQLSVVADQIGTPSWACGLAKTIWKALNFREVKGVFHWTDAGIASWYDFAVAIQKEALKLGLLKKRIPIKPIKTIDFPTPAKRPSYSVLDKTMTWETFGIESQHWGEALKEMMEEIEKKD
ncbi:MAG: dTDP-4-dehydrorhamnose reductase [Desulfobacterales bacterium]|nr:dTDP-4-dehydrorhamnose reductase [Desulfobacterales bacterium]